MTYRVEYYNARVLAEIEAWPVDILADYARLVELLMEHGPNLRMPHSKAMGEGMFELRPKGKEGIGRAFYCYLVRRRVVVSMPLSRRRSKPQSEISHWRASALRR